MTTESTAIATDPRQAYGQLQEYLMAKRSAIAHIAPKYLDTERMVRLALGASSRNPRLLQCTPQSWLMALMDCAFYGLEPNPVLGHAYLVPYQNRKLRGNPYEVTLQVGYKGLILLACEHAGFDDVETRLVYAGELKNDRFFETPEDPLKPFHHRPLYDVDERGEIVGAYAVGWRGPQKRPRFRYLTHAEIESYRSRSRSAKDGPWVTDWDAMAMKTAVRRMLALAQLQPGSKLGTALEQESALERDEIVRASKVIDLEQPTALPASKQANLAAELAKKAADAKKGDKTAPVEQVSYTKSVEEAVGDEPEGQGDLFVP